MPLAEILQIILVILLVLVLLLQLVTLLRGRGDAGVSAKLDALKEDSARVERTRDQQEGRGRKVALQQV